MFCRRCGKEIKTPSKFCPKCGANLGGDSFTKVADDSIVNENKAAKNNFTERNITERNITDNNIRNNNTGDYNIRDNNIRDYNDNYRPYEYNNVDKVQDNTVPKNTLSVPKRILSIVLCVFIVTLTIISSLVCSMRIGAQKDNIKKIVANEDISEIKINDQYLSEYLISNIDQTIVKQFKITTDQVDEILNDKQVKGMITDVVTDYTSMFILGEKPKNLNEESVIKNIQDIDSLIYNKTGYSLPEKDYEDIKKELSNGSLSFLIENNIKEDLAIDPYVVSIFFSVPAICILIALDIGLIILLFMVNNWKVKSFFAFLGISFIVTGSMNICLAIFMIVLSWINKIFLISALIRSVSIGMLIISAILFVAGLLLFIIQKKIIKTKR